MTSHAAADPGLADRGPFVATKLAEILVDGLEQLERDVDDRLRRQVGELVRQSCVLLDELGEIVR